MYLPRAVSIGDAPSGQHSFASMQTESAKQIANQLSNTTQYWPSQDGMVGAKMPPKEHAQLLRGTDQHENHRTRKPLCGYPYRGVRMPPSPIRRKGLRGIS